VTKHATSSIKNDYFHRTMKIIVADDHALVRAGLAQLLGELDAGVTVLEAGSYAEAADLLAAHTDATLALLDLNMPGMHGYQQIEALAEQAPTVPLVMFSASENPQDMQGALDAGAMGYIPKSESPAVTLNALRLVLAGGVYVPPALLRSAGAPAEAAPGDTTALTPRQREVLTMVIEGRTNKEIARAFELSEATVKSHVAAIFRALAVSNRTQAARAAETLGLVPPAPRR
jgi:DNA-binding NarL/FixJ family response regulator